MGKYELAANKILADLWQEMEDMNNKRIAEAAKADPKRYATSRVMRGNTGYTFWPVHARYTSRRKRGLVTVFICVSKRRNVAGNFLIWRQVERKARGGSRIERTDFRWSPSKREAFDIARRWVAKERAKIEAKKISTEETA